MRACDHGAVFVVIPSPAAGGARDLLLLWSALVPGRGGSRFFPSLSLGAGMKTAALLGTTALDEV